MKKFTLFAMLYVMTIVFALAVNWNLHIPYNSGADPCYPGPLTLHLNSTADDIVQEWGGADYASYIKGGRSILESGSYVTLMDKGFRFWTPGPYYVYAVIFMFGGDPPIPLVLLFVCAAVWAAFLCLFVEVCVLLEKSSRTPAIIVALALTAIPIVSRIMMWDLLLLSENIAIPLLFVAEAWICYSLLRPFSYGNAIIAAAIFALATMFRANNWPIAITTTLGLIATMLVLALFKLLSWERAKGIMKFSAITLFACGLFLLPYRLWMGQLTGANYIWPTSWALTWDKDADKIDVTQNAHWNTGPYVIDKMNFYADVDPEQAHTFAKRLERGEEVTINEYVAAAFVSIVKHPLKFFKYRLSILYEFLFRFKSDLFVLAAFAVALISCALRFRLQAVTALAMLLCFSVGVAGPSMIYHFEYRYVVTILVAFYLFIGFEIAMRLARLKCFQGKESAP
jgi:hypothetical protein